MIGSRLTSKFWVFALKKRLDSQAIPIYITKKGDNKAGAIIIRLLELCGRSIIYVQVPSEAGERKWIELTRDENIEIEKIILRQINIDNDAWVLEVEEVSGINFFDDFLLQS